MEKEERKAILRRRQLEREKNAPNYKPPTPYVPHYYFGYKIKFEMVDGSKCTKKMSYYRAEECEAREWLENVLMKDGWLDTHSRRKTVFTKDIKRFGYIYIGKSNYWENNPFKRRNTKPETKQEWTWWLRIGIY